MTKRKPAKAKRTARSAVARRKAARVDEAPTVTGSDSGFSASGRMRSSGPEQSVARILEATMQLLARQGLRSLSMSDVCRAAGVARGTLYRYFPTKESLLEGISQHVREQFEQGLAQACHPDDSGKQRFHAVIDFLYEYSSHTRGDRLLEVEPAFVLDFLGRHIDRYSTLMADALRPCFEEIEQTVGLELDVLVWSELILRANLSFFLIPPRTENRNLIRELEKLIDMLPDAPAVRGPAEALQQ